MEDVFGSVGSGREDHDPYPQHVGQHEFHAFVRQRYSDAYAESERYGYSPGPSPTAKATS